MWDIVIICPKANVFCWCRYLSTFSKYFFFVKNYISFYMTASSQCHIRDKTIKSNAWDKQCVISWWQLIWTNFSDEKDISIFSLDQSLANSLLSTLTYINKIIRNFLEMYKMLNFVKHNLADQRIFFVILAFKRTARKTKWMKNRKGNL